MAHDDADDTTTLRRGERQQVWAKPGPDDPTDGYDMRFVGYAITSDWAATIPGTHPAGGAGVYRWAASDVPEGPPGTAHLEPGSYRVQLRYTTGDRVGIEELPASLQVT